MVLRSKSVGEQDVADQQGAFAISRAVRKGGSSCLQTLVFKRFVPESIRERSLADRFDRSRNRIRTVFAIQSVALIIQLFIYLYRIG